MYFFSCCLVALLPNGNWQEDDEEEEEQHDEEEATKAEQHPRGAKEMADGRWQMANRARAFMSIVK